MGAVADAALAAGGEVIGVIPEALVDAEVAHKGLTELHVVGTMHQRKQAFTDLSDGFVTLPGGTGTMDELWEALSWAQLGYHAKPVGLLNVDGYYDGLIEFWDKMARGRLRPAAASRLLIVADTTGRRCSTRWRRSSPARRRSAQHRGARDLVSDPRSTSAARAAIVATRAASRSRGVEELRRRLAACSTARRASAPGCSMPGAGAATISPTGRTMAMR